MVERVIGVQKLFTHCIYSKLKTFTEQLLCVTVVIHACILHSFPKHQLVIHYIFKETETQQNEDVFHVITLHMLVVEQGVFIPHSQVILKV